MRLIRTATGGEYATDATKHRVRGKPLLHSPIIALAEAGERTGGDFWMDPHAAHWSNFAGFEQRFDQRRLLHRGP